MKFKIGAIIILIISNIITFTVINTLNQKQFHSFTDTFHKELAKVNRISINDGNTGDKYEINNPVYLEKITNSIMQAEYREIPDIAAGYTYSLQFYDNRDLLILQSIITQKTLASDGQGYSIKSDFSDLLNDIKTAIANISFLQ